jgi:serine/threonine-protein kinase
MTSAKQAKHELPGGLIGRYEVVQRIGVGGMAAVYKAIHVDLGREVALKVMPVEIATRPGAVERFRKEAQLAARLRHENIVTLYEVGESAGLNFLAMEYVEGTDLQNYIYQKGKLDPEEARRITIQATKALALAHKEGIIHRDIKPSNFLMTTRDGRQIIKLTDFGLARIAEHDDYQLTRAGTTIGTVDYIAPEQARNSRAADVRSDIYSLGCTLYHMLSGHPPFHQGDMMERLLKHADTEPEDIRLLNPKVPAGLVIVLQKMMAKNPDYRYQTPQELLKDLEHLPSAAPVSTREILTALASDAKPKAARGSSGQPQRIARSPSVRVLDSPLERSHAPTNRSPTSVAYSGRRRQQAEEESSSIAWVIWALLAGAVAVAFIIVLVYALKH